MGAPKRAAWALIGAAGRSPDDAQAPAWLLRAGQLLLEAGQDAEARPIFAQLLGGHGRSRPDRSQRLQAELALARLDDRGGRPDAAIVRLKRIIARIDVADPARRVDWAPFGAAAELHLARIAVAGMDWRHPPGSQPAVLKRALTDQAAALTRVDAALAAAAARGSVPTTQAALLELGRVYARFAHWLLAFPPPPGLDPETFSLYREALSDRTEPLFGKAAAAFERVLELGAQHHLGYAHVQAARLELDKLADLLLRPRPAYWRLRRPAPRGRLPSQQTRAALDAARRALAAEPGRAEHLLRAAEALVSADQPHLAVYILERLVPPSLEQGLVLVSAQLAAGELDRAWAKARDLTASNPHLAAARSQLGWLLLAFGDLTGLDALLDSSAADRAGPGLEPGEALVARGIVAFARDDGTRAAQAFERALAHPAVADQARFNLALVALAAREQAPDPAAQVQALTRAIAQLQAVTIPDQEIRELLAQARRDLAALAAAIDKPETEI